MLGEIENNSKEADQLLLDILLQRLGKSPDRIESILTIEEYNRIRVRDLLERAIIRGNKALTERIMQDYPCKTKADDMYILRMKAWAENVYYISDLLEVEEFRTAYGQYLIGENVKIII